MKTVQFKCRGCEKAAAEAEGKTRFELLDLDFAAALCDKDAAGVRGERIPNGWKKMEWTPEMEALYVAKVLRHLRGFVRATSPEEKRQEAAAIGCNANILHYHSKGEEK